MKKQALLSSLLILTSLGLSACQTKQSNTPSSEVTRKNQIVLNVTDVSLTIGEKFQLFISYEDLDAQYETSYISSDSQIIEVDNNGLVTAISEGNASINVSKGDAVATCHFLVTLNDQVPYIVVEGVQNHQLSLDLTTPFTFQTKIRIGNTYFNPDQITYEIQPNSGNGRMEDNVFIPTEKGDLNIKIIVDFQNYDILPYLLSVNIKESVVFSLMNDDGGTRQYSRIDLYTLNSYHGQNYIVEFSPLIKVVVDNVDKTNEATFEIIDSNNVVNYDAVNNKITAQKAGIATLRIKYLEYTKDVPIYVNYVYIEEYAPEGLIIDASVGEFPVDIFSQFVGDEKIIRATSLDGQIEYSVINGKVIGLKSHNLASQQIILYNNSVGCVVTFQAYAKIIKNAEDLLEFIIDLEGDPNRLSQFQNDGYYILNNDIDCTGFSYPAQSRVIGLGPRELASDGGFVGTFDGLGHTISNLTPPKGGLFLVLGDKAIVRNVAFKNADLKSSTSTENFVLATYVYTATIENVYINSNSDITRQDNAMVAACFTNSSRVKNCLFIYNGNITAPVNYGAMTVLTETKTSNNDSYSNVYVLSSSPMTVNRDYYCDTRRFSYLDEKELEYRPNKTVKHYLSEEEMKQAQNDYAGFNDKYWAVVDNMLTWKD